MPSAATLEQVECARACCNVGIARATPVLVVRVGAPTSLRDSHSSCDADATLPATRRSSYSYLYCAAVIARQRRLRASLPSLKHVLRGELFLILSASCKFATGTDNCKQHLKRKRHHRHHHRHHRTIVTIIHHSVDHSEGCFTGGSVLTNSASGRYLANVAWRFSTSAPCMLRDLTFSSALIMIPSSSASCCACTSTRLR